MAKPEPSRPADLPGELLHPLHHGHTLNLVPADDGVEFRCDGCKLPGAGARYECGGGAACNFDLHPGCALAPAERDIGGFPFVLLPEPDSGGRRVVCDACGGAARGLVYHCPDLGHDAHPCCATDLPERFAVAGLSLELRVAEAPPPPRRCVLCPDETERGRRRRALWSYRCDVGDGAGPVLLHVPCARGMVASDEARDKVIMASDDAYRSVVHSLAYGGHLRPVTADSRVHGDSESSLE